MTLPDKSLDLKLDLLWLDHASNAFILADAKDADMAFGLASPGCDPATGRLRTMAEYRQLIREIVKQGLIDIALMSASSADLLAGEENLFHTSKVTPATRANDSTDIWLAGGTGDYSQSPSLPYRSARIDQMMYPNGKYDKSPRVDLGLYSITLNNDAVLDRESLEAYAEFREEAAEFNFRHFLEIFPPNAPQNLAPDRIGRFVADSVARILAGITQAERPMFLKIPYLGPALTEQLVAYDTSVIVGIMGGPAGTTFDAFSLLEQARRHGVRAALFGRHINQAEDQLLFIQHLRWIADGELAAEEGVKSYHAQLAERGVTPHRKLEDDLAATVKGLASYQSETPR